MLGEERRDAIVSALEVADAPLSGTALGQACGVTRQVVVQDIALLRSRGVPIVSTNRGYVLSSASARPTRTFKCHHGIDGMAEELMVVVDLGATMVDVFVTHRVYGTMTAELGISSRRDVARFTADLANGVSTPLSQLTDGYHFHHVCADSEDVLDDVERALGEKGFLAELLPHEVGTGVVGR